MSEPAPSRAKFDKLRAAYIAKQAKWSELETSFRCRYGDGYQKHWLKAGDATKLERASKAMDKAATALFAHIQSISPRDWSYGVPCHWIYEKLTWEDAIRPKGEPLGVVPPLSYGASHPRT